LNELDEKIERTIATLIQDVIRHHRRDRCCARCGARLDSSDDEALDQPILAWCIRRITQYCTRERTDELVLLKDVLIVVSFQISAAAIKISGAKVSPTPGKLSG
jgi:hypothetical protein